MNPVLLKCDSDDTSPLAFHVLNYILMLRDAEIFGIKAAVDWRRGSQFGFYKDETAVLKYGPNVWDWYFKQPFASVEEIEVIPHDEWPQVFPVPANDNGEIVELLRLLTLGNIQTYETLKKTKNVINKFLIWHDSIQTRANNLFQKYELNPIETIAVSHRGTNKYVDLRLHPELIIYPIESYFSSLDYLLEENPNRKIWIQPEEQTISDKLIQRYPSAVIMPDFYLVNPAQKLNEHTISDFINPKSGYEKGLDIVTLMVMFSMCGAFVKNVGNLSDISAALSKGNVILISELK